MPHNSTMDIQTFTRVEINKIIQETKIITDAYPDGVKLMSIVCDTSEKGLRDALIKLGWTPPEDKSNKPEDNKHF